MEKSVFTQLRELGDIVKRTNILEQKVDVALNRDCKKERNILQCPQDSMNAIHDTKSHLKKMSSDALKIHSNLQLISHQNQRLMNDADTILEYLRTEIDKTEVHLKKFGYVPPASVALSSSLDISQSKESSRTSILKDKENEVCDTKAKLPENEAENNPLALPKSPIVPNIAIKNIGIDYLVSPEAPVLYQNDNERSYILPPLSAGRFHSNAINHTDSDTQAKEGASHMKREFFPQLPESPKSPDLNIQHGNYHAHTCVEDVRVSEETSNSLARKKFFETPKVKSGRNVNTESSQRSAVSNFTSDAPYFAVFNQLPQSPTLTDIRLPLLESKPSNRIFPNHDSKIDPTSHCNDGRKHGENAYGVDTPDSPEVDFKLYGRKSIGLLDDSTDKLPSPDDITVLLLGGKKNTAPTGTFAMTQCSPDSPDLTDYNKRLPYTRYDDQLPETPPSPDLTSYKTYQKQDNTKENIDPTEASDLSSFKIKESQYEDLPSYLKRLISYELGSECAKKILENTSSLPGDKYSHVITKSKIEEVTCLGGKTKSFIFMMTNLKVMKKISGTDYFEIIV